MFRFFQINVHLNLKTDENFDLFYRSCQSSLINRENNYEHTRKRLILCDSNYINNDYKSLLHNFTVSHLIVDPCTKTFVISSYLN